MSTCTKVVIRPGTATAIVRGSNVDKVSVIADSLSQVVVRPTQSSVVTHGDRSHVVITAGLQGVSGADGGDGVMARAEVEQIVRDVIHADSPDDGIQIDNTGNIFISIGTLQSLP